MKLSSVSLLVSLNISQWTARKYDKKASDEVAKTFGVYNFVGRYNKALLPMTDELNKIINIGQAMRMAFYTHTLPYTYEGVRLIPSKNYFEFTSLMNNYTDKWNMALDIFISHYEDHVSKAEQLLGELYKASDYPDVTDIAGKFNVSLSISPVPEGEAFYQTLSQDMAKEAFDKYVESEENTSRKAMDDCWHRLYGVVYKFAAKLASDHMKLREDHVQIMLTNAEEMCNLLEKLNIADDAHLTEMCTEVRDTLLLYNADVLSNHKVTQNEVRDSAAEIMRKMDAYMGGMLND